MVNIEYTISTKALNNRCGQEKLHTLIRVFSLKHFLSYVRELNLKTEK